MTTKRFSINDISRMKGKNKIVCLTAYTYPFAQIFDKYVDLLLVGDSLGMTIYGMDSTLPVSLDMMINHGKAVVKGSSQALVVIDMPFGSYQESPAQAFRNAALILKETGCQAVKLEGGREMAATITHLVTCGIPVMGHIGLMPQHVNEHGGYKVQGNDSKSAKKLLDDASAIEAAGAFAIVIEGVKNKIAKDLVKKTSIPTIGIGAALECDGQVLVCDDMTGLFTQFTPKFVKQYSNISKELDNAAKQFSDEVRSGSFPTKDHLFL